MSIRRFTKVQCVDVSFTRVLKRKFKVMEKIYGKVKKQQEGKKTLNKLSPSDVIDLTSKESDEPSQQQKCCNM